MRGHVTGSRAIAAASSLAPYTRGRPRVPGKRGGGTWNRAVSRRTWPMTAWPRRSAAWSSERRIYQASSSRHSGPRWSPTARSSPLARAIFPAWPAPRHRPVTIGTQRGRSRQGTTAASVTKAWHSRKAGRFGFRAWSNRPAFLLCQAFVTLAAVVPCRDRPRCVPIVTGLCRGAGHAGKIALAKGLLRAVGDHLGPLCLLLDAWYMRRSLLQAALRRGHAVIGQVRRDTALFQVPPPRLPGTRGRPRVYGARLDAAAIARLPVTCPRIAGYGGRRARLRHVLCRARFLRGVTVHAVWCELEKRGGGWAKQRLLLSTDTALSASAII